MKSIFSQGVRLWSRRHRSLSSLVITWMLLAIILVSWLPVALAQSPAETLTELTVDLWPDYDQSAVLVLLTGRLPAETSFPTSVTIPLPVNATLNAVARLTPEGLLMDDIDFTVEDGAVTLTAPSERFRIEYYAPYTTTDGERSYRFAWASDELSVEQMAVTVQQPIVADTMETTPAALTTSIGPDGLTYHHLPTADVPAQANYNMELAYEAAGSQLTADMLVTEPTQPELIPSPTPDTTGESGVNVALVLTAAAAALVVAVVIWQVISMSNRRTSKHPVRKSRKAGSTRPVPSSKKAPQAPQLKGSSGKASVSFCHQCGQQISADDRFCRSCGTALKGK